MSRFVWLASYPKSGNTWFRMFMANLGRGDAGPAGLNEIHRSPTASSRAAFDAEFGVSSSDLSDDEAECLRADAYRAVAARESRDIYCKVHDAYVTDQRGRPVFPTDATRAAIYFVRNPLDVCVSYAHHSGKAAAHAVDALNDARSHLCASGPRPSRQFRQRLLDWSGHVTSWLDGPDFPVHVMRFEDMKTKPVDTFHAAARFLGWSTDRREVEQALEHARFERLQGMEKTDGFRERPRRSTGFFRKGVVGSWREALTPEERDALVAAHRPAMTRLGYLSRSGELRV